MTQRLSERFWPNVDVRGPDECWPWLKSCGGGGYGHMWHEGQCVDTHRLAWLVARGPIPEGLQVLHSCDNRPCCNPAHLFLGTQQDNIVDMHAKHRHPGGRGPRGSRNGSARLTDAAVAAIRDSVATQYELATVYGVSQSTISRVRRGELWRADAVAA